MKSSDYIESIKIALLNLQDEVNFSLKEKITTIYRMVETFERKIKNEEHLQEIEEFKNAKKDITDSNKINEIKGKSVFDK